MIEEWQEDSEEEMWEADYDDDEYEEIVGEGDDIDDGELEEIEEEEVASEVVGAPDYAYEESAYPDPDDDELEEGWLKRKRAKQRQQQMLKALRIHQRKTDRNIKRARVPARQATKRIRRAARRRILPAPGSSTLSVRGRKGNLVRLPLSKRIVTLRQFNKRLSYVDKSLKDQRVALGNVLKSFTRQGQSFKALRLERKSGDNKLKSDINRLGADMDAKLLSEKHERMTDLPVLATAALAFLVYGEPNDLLGKRNSTIALGTGVALYLPELFTMFGGKKTRAYSRAVQWATPVVHAALLYYLLEPRPRAIITGHTDWDLTPQGPQQEMAPTSETVSMAFDATIELTEAEAASLAADLSAGNALQFPVTVTSDVSVSPVGEEIDTEIIINDDRDLSGKPAFVSMGDHDGIDIVSAKITYVNEENTLTIKARTSGAGVKGIRRVNWCVIAGEGFDSKFNGKNGNSKNGGAAAAS